MKKTYVLDSSVLLFAPYALRVFEDNSVCIPGGVLAEMARAARVSGPHQREAIAFGRLMDNLIDREGKTAELEGGGTLAIYGTESDDVFAAAKAVAGTIVSRDPHVRVKARTDFIPAEPFRYEQGDLTDHIYTGRCKLYVTSEEMREFAAKGVLPLRPGQERYATDDDDVVISEAYMPHPNEYLTLVDSSNPSTTMLGRYVKGEGIIPLCAASKGPVFDVTPRNVGQKFALDALMSKDIPLVILRGPAGTAKSFLSMAAGLEQSMEQSLYKKCLLTRPNTKMDNDIGYLKGDETEKILPILRGLLDNIENLMDKPVAGQSDTDIVKYLMERGVVEMQSLAYMRGRSIMNQYIVADEMQNSTPTQALSIITRAGEGTKIVLCGDTEQIDSPYLDSGSNGLSFAAEKMKDSPLCAQVTFTERESTRSPLAQEAIQLMSQTEMEG